MDAQNSPSTSGDPLGRFASYRFADDAEYQQGLAGILSSGALQGKSEDEQEELMLRSEVFYFNRVSGASLDLDAARAIRNGRKLGIDFAPAPVAPPPQLPPKDKEQITLTFAQIKELIEQGKTDNIPNNKVIPNVLSSETPSESRTSVRKKPWEAEATA
ncbi:hypothetical protein GSI_09313 [Ganoderma sinense ZZ0214-1]|uniref:Uncharacterized protein n=1 Tax=Ganoderma sinense ZZ0214-1 TaxID=1077348 RepID=A0A2G8S668_9APHY|nr:hypothetical protein GSI_09313 [Ganoderma sinense ZZ0214-1]